MKRPEPWGSGQYVPQRDPHWRLISGRQCSFPHCTEIAVAAMKRPNGEYRYCTEHMSRYRRWIEGGEVMRWVRALLSDAEIDAALAPLTEME